MLMRTGWVLGDGRGRGVGGDRLDNEMMFLFWTRALRRILFFLLVLFSGLHLFLLFFVVIICGLSPLCIDRLAGILGLLYLCNFL